MDRIHDTGRDFIITFQNRTKLIQFVSNHFAHIYKNHLELMCATAMDDLKEQKNWKKRIAAEVPELKRTLEVLLRTKLMFNKKFKLTCESAIFKIAFKWLGVKDSPTSYFPVNVEYKIDDLVFNKRIK